MADSIFRHHGKMHSQSNTVHQKESSLANQTSDPDRKEEEIPFQKAKETGLRTDFEKYKRLRNKLTLMLKESKRNYLKKLNTYNKKQFWKAIKSLNQQKTSIPTLSENDINATSNHEKAEMLNKFFSKCFNHSLPCLSFADRDDLDPVDEVAAIDDIYCTVEYVEHQLQELDTSKANGPDGISAKMLKETAKIIAPSVAKLFNLSLRTGCFPTHWKTSHVVPIPKSDQHTSPSNYRPISLLSILSKVLERHVHSLLTEHLSPDHPLSQDQWGFQAKRSTTLALLRVTNDWLQSLDSGMEVCAAFFDIRKAFDTVPHRNLISKLKSLHLHPAITRWICNYLTGHYQRVIVDGAISQSIPVISGVPQGSVLGPLLFLIYIDSVSHLEISQGTKMVLYADDMLVYKDIHSCEGYTDLQNDINQIYNWSVENSLSFNPSKCKQMVISRKRRPLPHASLQLGNTTLERVYKYMYLGVTITAELCWSEHIHTKCSKAKKLVGLLHRRFQSNTDPTMLFNLYIALIRPHLEYACEVWNPHLQKDKTKLEQVQKFGLRMCTKKWNADYGYLLTLFDIPPLEHRRLCLSLCTTYKIINKLVDFLQHIFVSKSTSNLRSSKNTSLLLYTTLCQNYCLPIFLCSSFLLGLEYTTQTHHGFSVSSSL